MAIVLYTYSFNRVLTPADVERVHEEVAEFNDFYRRRGTGKVDFAFSLIQVDRRLERREIAEVSPNRYYLSRENVEPELTARGFRGRFDEVIALHAWSNANPDRALQAYGGGAVGPDGKFLGDAGFNSIPVMGRDPGTIGQVLIHEVLHNLDDMFSRSDMPDEFLNSDEMSRNMAQLLRERPGAFLPGYTDAEMLAYAERERQGREAYPWAMQLVYYGWMLERTPREAWARLRYGRMAPASDRPVWPLYATTYTSEANDSTYLPVLAPRGSVVSAAGRALAPRTYTQTDFDGAPISSGEFFAAWVPLGGASDTVPVPIRGPGGRLLARALVVRQRAASVVVEPSVVHYVEAGGRPALAPRVLRDRCCGDGPPLPGARVSIEGVPDAGAPPLGTYDVAVTGSASGWYVHPVRVRLTVRRNWRVADDGPLTVTLGSPLALNASVREDRGRTDVEVNATILGRRVNLAPLGDGRYTAVLTEELPFGLHWATITARAPGGETVTDSVRVYVRPAGWIRVPDAFACEADGRVAVTAVLQSRMGREIRESQLPLVAVVGDEVTALPWRHPARRYAAWLHPPAAATRVVVTSLVGDLQRRVVPILQAGAGGRPSGVDRGVGPPDAETALPPYAAALRIEHPPAIDGDLGDWPATGAASVELSPSSFLLTDTAMYHGAGDLAARIRLAWDDSTLYVGGDVTDDSLTAGDAWDVDRVNLVFDMKDDTTPLTYATPNPPLDAWQDDDYWVFWRNGGTSVRRFGKTNADPVPGARLATQRTALGWRFEVALPRSALPGYVPFVGQVAGMQVFVTDGDGEASATELMWSARWPYAADGIEWRLAELGQLLFVDAPLR
ncbi:MAG: hypothetical protein HY705_01395 [Gemmatimonadetes bacterium]|nr:hypothetical protein [Gemmatimonadota bacterium]